LPDLSQIVAWIALGFTAGMALTLAAQMLNGQINTRRLLWGRHRNGDLYFSPERVQLLAFTLWVAFSYLKQAAQSSSSLPAVSPITLALLGGSHSYYLGAKAFAMLSKK